MVAGKELLERGQQCLSEENYLLLESRGQSLNWDELATSFRGTDGARRNQRVCVLAPLAVKMRIDEI